MKEHPNIKHKIIDYDKEAKTYFFTNIYSFFVSTGADTPTNNEVLQESATRVTGRHEAFISYSSVEELI